MAETKINLPDDLLSSKPFEDPLAAKDDALTGNDDEKLLMGFLDDSKDQVASDSSIPLSPQWLYVKSSESKPGLSASPGDMRALSSLTHGNSVDPVQKEGWRLDGSQDKKEWRKNAPEIESSRRWREEERETGLLGRRDRRKEGDRENEYRKNDRRSDNASIRETTETRPLSSSDRWHDVTSRNSGHETRRDSKWSSRWGPEDKEKDSRSEKKLDVEKEDAHNDKQSFVSSNRSTAERESDSRDKWRPRHRQEAHTVGSTVYRAAPGFGLERGRGEGSNVGFAPGRGRSNINGNVSLIRPSSMGPIGAAPEEGKSALSADTFCYPRGKLLDIYRKHKLFPSFDSIPVGLEEVPPITQLDSVDPLAFVAPDVEEEAIMQDIGKGKIISSGAVYNSTRDKIGGVNDNGTGVEDTTLTESKHERLSTSYTDDAGNDSNIKKLEIKVTDPTDDISSGRSTPLVLKGNDTGNIREMCSSHLDSEYKVSKTVTVKGDGQMENSASLRLPNMEDVESAAAFDVHTGLPDDSNSLFDLSTLQDIPTNEQYVKSRIEVKLLEQVAPPEELSLFYQDPQGEIQGPFLGVDIISWFQQGFFGTDLPVCLSDAPEGTPFQELGEVMPHLKHKEQTASAFNHNNKPQLDDTLEGTLEAGICTPDFIDSAATNDQWALPDFRAPLGHHAQPVKSKEDVLEAHHGRLPPSDLEDLASVTNPERRSFHDFVAQENEEALFSGRPGSSSGNSLGKPAGSLHDSVGNPSSCQLLANELGETIMFNHKGLTDNNNNDVHPLGLLWSEVEGTHLNRSHLSNVSSGIGDQGYPINTADRRENPLFSHQQNFFAASADSPVVGDAWSGSHRRNALASQNVFQGAMDVHRLARMEQDSDRFNLTEELPSQQLQKQLLQQQHLLSNHPSIHLNGSVLEQLQNYQSLNLLHQQSVSQPMSDLENLLKIQLQQKQQFEHQEQRRLQQQQFEQQEQHRLQQQQQFEQQEQHRLQQQQQFEQQEQRRLQQQQLHRQMQLQQQSQAEQLLLKQLLHHQMHDPGFVQSQVDPLTTNNMLDQYLFRQQLLHERQQQSHPPRHHDPALEQLIHTRFGQSLHPENHSDLLELLSHAKHGQMHPMEQQLLLGIQQEQLKARQFSAASRQQLGIEEERHGGVWTVDESGQFVRAAANPHQMHSAGVGSLDFYQRQQRPSSFEQPSNFEQNLALHEQLHRGLYEPRSLPFERSISLHAGAPEMNMDIVNSLSRVQGLDVQEQHAQMRSANQMGSFSTGIHSHSPQIANQFHASHLDGIDSRLHPNGPMESRIHQLHLKAERKKRDSEMDLLLEDPYSWASAMPNDGNSKQVFMDLHHNHVGHPLNQSLELREGASTSTYEKRVSPSDYPYHILSGQVGSGDSFVEHPHGTNLGHVAERANSMENSEKSSFRSNSGAFIGDKWSSWGINETAQALYADPNMTDESSVDDVLDLAEVKDGKKGKRRGSKSKMVNKPLTEAQEIGVEQAEVALMDCGDLQVKAPIKHASLGRAVGGGAAYNYEMGVDNAYGDKMDKDWMSTGLTKEFDNPLLKRPPASRALSSQEALSEMAAAPTVKGKIPRNFSASEERRRDPVGNPATQVSEATASSKKEMRFRRSSSCSDSDVSEPSFIDMLKSTKKPPPEMDTTIGFSELDAAHGGKGGKKKGKKGRQIDPALLGFKVSSNRILMGEIQRLDD